MGEGGGGVGGFKSSFQKTYSSYVSVQFQISGINCLFSYLSMGSPFSDPRGQTEIACFITSIVDEMTRNTCPTLV